MMPMSTDGEVRYESVFRETWRARQAGGARAGELVKQPGWINAGLLALGVALCAGAVAASTITVEQTATLPAIVAGTSVTAIRSGADTPAPGTVVQFRGAEGETVPGVVDEVDDTEVIVRLERAVPASAGQLIISTGRQRIIEALLPSLG